MREVSNPPSHWEYWDGTPLTESKVLRWGFSTAACMTALLVASWQKIFTGRVSIVFGDGIVRSLPLCKHGEGPEGFVCIRKNAGDDPDCTHGLLVYGRLSKKSLAPCSKDCILSVGEASLTLHACEGIGLSTRPGLDCPQGEIAISQSARALLRKNLRLVGMQTGIYYAEIGIKGGEELAKHTLNPMLGVLGGLSILGTTGLVRPFSAAAYEATIRLQVRACALTGYATIFVCTGRKSQLTAQEWAKEQDEKFSETAFIPIADFIGASIEAAVEYNIQRVIVACMPGKLLKYTACYHNTHAHSAPQDMNLLFHALRKLGIVLSFPVPPASMREALHYLSSEEQERLFSLLVKKAFISFRRLAARDTLPRFAILLLDFEGKGIAYYKEESFFP